MNELMEKNLEMDEDEVPTGDTEEVKPLGPIVKEKRNLTANDKKALDTMVNQLELEGWEISELGKKEKFNAEGEIVVTYTAVMKKDTEVQV